MSLERSRGLSAIVEYLIPVSNLKSGGTLQIDETFIWTQGEIPIPKARE